MIIISLKDDVSAIYKGKKKSMYCFYNLYTNNPIENDVNK